MRWQGRVRGTGPWASLSAAVPILLVLLTACTSGPPAPGPAPEPTPGTYWRPEPGVDWQWQLSGRLDPSVDAPVYDIDGFENGAAQVAELHRRDRKVICYLSTGAWEEFRPDAGKFPASVLGKGNGWKGERWLDIRSTGVLEPLMDARIAMCAKKGFDAVEPDNMDAYLNTSGFPLTADDQLRYNRLIARLAHAHGLAVGLKNDLDQIPELEPDFDFAVNEQCAQYEECDAVTPFIEAGKAVFHAEYELEPARYCAESRRLKLSSLRKEYALGPWRRTCWA
ncbi:endo alpha-1,4 polygalactosaminidase [Streptomyces sp. NPDC057136]|uniref:endo alpha-1,4 polygalactosaminidase n=1 Tax=Streptomyces sp. NPDC057136 TaxID=3346029 RepID=UPI00362EE3C0